MARVPTFEGGKRREPLHQNNFTVRATPEAFGAATGRGLVALGQGVGDVGDAIITVADLRAQNALKTAQADYMEGARALISDPDTGFLSRTGSDAIDGQAAVEAQLEELGRSIAENLPGQVRPQFQDFRIGHNTNLGREMLRHKAEQTKAETRSAHNRRIAALKQEAIRNHTDPVAHLNSLLEAENELRIMAGWDGLSDEETEQRQVAFRDSVQSDIILQMAEAGPLAAQAHYETVKDTLQEQARQGIERVLNPSLEIAHADAKAEEIFSGINAIGSGNAVHDTSDLLVESVVNNAFSLNGDAHSDTLIGSSGNDTLAAADPERAQRVEQVRQRVRQRGKVNAIRLARAGVMLSPGNLLLSTILGAPLAIAVNRAGPDAPLAPLLADALGFASGAPLLAELESELSDATAGDLLSEFSSGAAQYFGGVDVDALLNGIASPQERSLAADQLNVRFAAAHKQGQTAADQRVKAAFSEIAQGGGLASLSLDARSALEGRLKTAAVEFANTLAVSGEPKTDFSLARTLALQFAEDPDGFGAVNIYEHRAEFSQTAFELLESLYELARKGSDEADERAAEIAALFEHGARHVIDAGLDPDSPDKNLQPKISHFLFRFVAEADSFRKANGALPKDGDLAEIARQLSPLLPEITRTGQEPPVHSVSPGGEGEKFNPTAFSLPPDIRNTHTWRTTFERLVEQHEGDELAAAEDLEQIFQAIRTKPIEELSPQEQDVVAALRLERLNFSEADAQDLSSIYRNWEPWKQRYRYFLDQNGGRHGEAAALADLAVEEAIRINTDHAGVPQSGLSNAQRLFVQQIRFRMNGEDAAVFRSRRPLMRPEPGPVRVLVPKPKDLTPAFRSRQPWKNLYAQLLPYFGGNEATATIAADAMISVAEGRGPEKFTLGGMTPRERYIADQVRFNRYGGPEASATTVLNRSKNPSTGDSSVSSSIFFRSSATSRRLLRLKMVWTSASRRSDWFRLVVTP